MNSLIHSKNSTMLPLLIALAFAWFALSLTAQAVVPAPDGGYPGGNTAEGQNALFSLSTGGFNTAVGFLSLRSNTTGQFNTAIGAGTLVANTADQNTATGAGALVSNATGAANTANGVLALFSNTGGLLNTATGASALFNNTIGTTNTATGGNALFRNTTGSFNTAVGSASLLSNTTGTQNTALGTSAGQGVTTANNVICIAHIGANVSNSCFIGNIRGVTTANADAIPVLIDSFGQLGTASSSRRFKKEIKPMEGVSEAILALKPVTFHYKSDKTDTPQFGLIAEEVAEVNPDLVVHDAEGKVYTVRYEAVNAMLLNEFLKEHRKVEQQRRDFEAALDQQQKQIDSLTAGLQKVSAQLELGRPATQTVLNRQ